MKEAATTLLDELVSRLRSYDGADGKERPAVVVWTDPTGAFQPLIELAQTKLPELIVLGAYAPASRRGPAPWIRCVVDRTLAEPAIPLDRVPILYMPNIARQHLRAGSEASPELRPLVELVFRGSLWLQTNGSDWTLQAFLTSARGGLGLDVACDRATIEAAQRALREVANLPLTSLRGRRLEADDFDRLLSEDTARDLLHWIADPKGTPSRLGSEKWGAFCDRVRSQHSFDPAMESAMAAAARMAEGEGAWSSVWSRFEEAPQAYEGVVSALRKARPGKDSLFADASRWAHLNEKAEADLRAALDDFEGLTQPLACEAVLSLEQTHAPRRKSVWARLGRAPMAGVLKWLAEVAAEAQKPLFGATAEDFAADYSRRGWKVDKAAWRALEHAQAGDRELTAEVLAHLLHPWLEDSARAFQSVLQKQTLRAHGAQTAISAAPGGCVMFVDGLRFDLAQVLADELEGKGYRTVRKHRWAALPTVTATGKVDVSPVSGAFSGDAGSTTFEPRHSKSSKTYTAQLLRDAIHESGYQILDPAQVEMPDGVESRGWIEFGQIDDQGHKMESGLARQIPQEIESIAEKVQSLLRAGWKSVRIVTDHGWLLLPGGLPKIDLPAHLAESRWARCAIVAGATPAAVCEVPWHWNPTVSIATAPGIACFNRHHEYAHGGVSVQECLLPDLLIESSESAKAQAAIHKITWVKMRCHVVCSGATPAVRADLRLKAANGASILNYPPKAIGEDGATSLVIDDTHESAPLMLVLLDTDGTVLAEQATRCGQSS
ncbi:MAG: BREX-1 system phosphatase PglZ type B [Planctomycetes bacterium]|nr:BREX-1 system phosphatase PglZ type B [Planctomycetota bacterium]